MKPKKTIWYTRDRRGEHWFSEKPHFVGGFDYLDGKRATPSQIKKARIIRNFTCEVRTEHGAVRTMYPKFLRFES